MTNERKRTISINENCLYVTKQLQKGSQAEEKDKVIKEARKSATPKTLTDAFSVLDKAVKSHLIHKNKAARLKSRLSKLLKK